MESKRLKTEALAKAREFIDDHPSQLKSFKIGSLATTREFIDVHFHPTPTPIGRAAAPAATHPVGPEAVGPSGSGPTSAVVG